VVRGDRPEPYSLAWMTAEQDDHGGGSSSGPGPGSSTLLSLDTNLSVGGLVATVVPEPASLGLFFVAAGMLVRRNKRSTRLS